MKRGPLRIKEARQIVRFYQIRPDEEFLVRNVETGKQVALKEDTSRTTFEE